MKRWLLNVFNENTGEVLHNEKFYLFSNCEKMGNFFIDARYGKEKQNWSYVIHDLWNIRGPYYVYYGDD